jgi:hypothetical protein
MTSCHWKPKYKNGLLKQVVEIAATKCALYTILFKGTCRCVHLPMSLSLTDSKTFVSLLNGGQAVHHHDRQTP